jgi:hypothetical protein
MGVGCLVVLCETPITPIASATANELEHDGGEWLSFLPVCRPHRLTLTTPSPSPSSFRQVLHHVRPSFPLQRTSLTPLFAAPAPFSSLTVVFLFLHVSALDTACDDAHPLPDDDPGVTRTRLREQSE